jgi:hypothetical protein
VRWAERNEDPKPAALQEEERSAVRQNSKLNQITADQNSMRCYIFTLDGRIPNAQEIDCSNAEEASQLSTAAVANDPVEVWCGPRGLARFEPERKRARPLSRLCELLTLAERRGPAPSRSQQRSIPWLLTPRCLPFAFGLSRPAKLQQTSFCHMILDTFAPLSVAPSIRFAKERPPFRGCREALRKTPNRDHEDDREIAGGTD